MGVSRGEPAGCCQPPTKPETAGLAGRNCLEKALEGHRSQCQLCQNAYGGTPLSGGRTVPHLQGYYGVLAALKVGGIQAVHTYKPLCANPFYL